MRLSRGLAGVFCVFFGFFASVSVQAQVPQIIHYQGRIVTGTTNFEGAGQFRFALVNGTGSITYWSNDGTSVAGSQPTAAVMLPVVKGLYSVLLGDISLPNMTNIPASVFANPDVRLRVWFNDGVNGSQLLSPDARIASVGYAMLADGVKDGAITTAKIAAGAVTSAQLAPGSVEYGALAKPPQSGTVAGASLTYAFGIAPFTVSFPNPYTSPPVVTLGATLASGAAPFDCDLQVSSTTASQFSAWVSTNTSRPVVLDAGPRCGENSSAAMLSGQPAVAYTQVTGGNLKFVSATNGAGTDWNSPVVVDAGGNSGQVSLAQVGAAPAISYYDNNIGRLKYVRANDLEGTTWAPPIEFTLDGAYSSLAVVNGNPAISFFDIATQDLRYLRANDSVGSTWAAAVTIDSIGSVGLYTSLAVVNGNPAVAYYNSSLGFLKFVRANDASGASWGAAVPVDSPATAAVGQFASLKVVSGNPAIAYYDVTNRDLKYVRATNANGSAWGASVTVDSVGFVGEHASLQVVTGGFPAICYFDATNFSLKYVRALDVNGATWGAPVTVDRDGAYGNGCSMTALTGGTPVIAYNDGGRGDLKFIKENAPPTNFNINWIALPP